MRDSELLGHCVALGIVDVADAMVGTVLGDICLLQSIYLCVCYARFVYSMCVLVADDFNSERLPMHTHHTRRPWTSACPTSTRAPSSCDSGEETWRRPRKRPPWTAPSCGRSWMSSEDAAPETRRERRRCGVDSDNQLYHVVVRAATVRVVAVAFVSCGTATEVYSR